MVLLPGPAEGPGQPAGRGRSEATTSTDDLPTAPPVGRQRSQPEILAEKIDAIKLQLAAETARRGAAGRAAAAAGPALQATPPHAPPAPRHGGPPGPLCPQSLGQQSARSMVDQSNGAIEMDWDDFGEPWLISTPRGSRGHVGGGGSGGGGGGGGGHGHGRRVAPDYRAEPVGLGGGGERPSLWGEAAMALGESHDR